MRQTVRPVKSECTGCGACVSICPVQAISMKMDEEGFLYPSVDGSKCIGCDLCEKRCPVGKPLQEHKQQIYGVQHKDEQVRSVSSSGGVFTALARNMLERGGVVFGASFDESLRVEHIGAFDETEIAGMRGSKYVQSDAADAVANAKSLLERGIPVLFSGTPCQIAGVKAAIGKKHADLLLTVDFVCHGVPSPGVFASYLKELEHKHGKRVTGYSFRDKRLGWKDFSAVATFEDGTESVGQQRTEPFLYGFLQNLYLRPACVQCEALRGSRRMADITMADLWGAQDVCPEKDDDKGLSLVFVNTKAGMQAFEACKGQMESFPIRSTDALLRFNPGIVHTASAHNKRDAFFAHYAKHGFDSAVVMKLLAGPGKMERIARRIAHLPKGVLRRIRVLFGK